MQSSWSDAEARRYEEAYPDLPADLALRVYTSRLIGVEADLVLHGGGNTSVKTRLPDATGQELEVLCVKGSGADLSEVEPWGLPAVELQPLLRLRELDELTDHQMVAELRRRLLDPQAPNPSVEALLHAFLPHKFVDHTHADAILAVTNQPDGEQLCQQLFGDEVAILPWIMPGFPLAKAVAEAVEQEPNCIGVVLLHHGLFTFGDDAKTSYERMIDLVDRAERFVAERIGGAPSMFQSEPGPLSGAERRRVLCDVLPRLRGALASRRDPEHLVRLVADWRCEDAVASFAAHPAAPELCATGPITPDHIIRAKGRYLSLSREVASDRQRLDEAVAEFIGWYEGYFANSVRPRGVERMLDPAPIVVVIEGVGLVALRPQQKAARIAADIAEHSLKVWAQGRDLGQYVPLSEDELAAMEYWQLELDKLGKKKPQVLEGQIALVTGAAGAIGSGIAEALLEAGACALLTDLDADRLDAVQQKLGRFGSRVSTAIADLTDPAAVAQVFEECTLAFGGVDLVVPSAGIAYVSRLEEMDPDRFEEVVRVNATATTHVLKQAARVLREQGTGGNVVLQVSKNAFAPGAGFGAYSASKAAVLQLGRIAALEFAEFGVRVNMVNADAVFGDAEIPSKLWEEVGPDRMRARGLDAEGLREFYRERSLLKVAVTPADVAAAVLFFAAGSTPTTGAVLPVDAGIPEAFPR
ncbi:MAG: bifunctional aldolase/short-chain dehydrogenase [Planctomycetota bacterium]|nr:bifunctional aldolase/short-chain dehydrogenase [Planctomycetota bacterium]